MIFSLHADKGLRGFRFDRVRDEGLGVQCCLMQRPDSISDQH